MAIIVVCARIDFAPIRSEAFIDVHPVAFLLRLAMSSLPAPVQHLFLKASVVVAVFLVSSIPLRAGPIEINSEVSRDLVEIGDVVTITLSANLSDEGEAVHVVGADIVIDEHWDHRGQSIMSGWDDDGRPSKRWTFELLAMDSGRSEIFPIIHFELANISGGSLPDSVVGDPITIVIVVPQETSSWPWIVAGATVVGIAFWRGIRAIRRKRQLAVVVPLPEPFDEACQMLEAATANCREDRAVEYLSDVERILLGYLSRRCGRPLLTATPDEIVKIISDYLVKPLALDQLRAILSDCTDARYGGGRPVYDQLVELQERARSVLEQLNDSWVKVHPASDDGGMSANNRSSC